jgi:Lar family restriction alleviation protein
LEFKNEKLVGEILEEVFMTNPATLKPCPFCGSKKKLNTLRRYNEDFFSVICACGVDGPYAETSAEAIQKWNTRAE